MFNISFSKTVPFMRKGGKVFVEWGLTQMTIWRMRIACWIPKAKYTHAVCVIHIAFPLQQWLQESTSMLRYTYIACLVNIGSGYNCVASFTSRPLYT